MRMVGRKSRETKAKTKLHVKKGDTVVVLSGKDRGVVGQILYAHPSTGKVTVEGANMVIRHQRAPRDNPFAQMQQGRIEKPAPLFASKVMLQCPHCHKGTRPHTVEQPDGRRARVCKKCGNPID